MRLSYTQFKTAFGLTTLSVTDYVNVVYNEASKIEEVGCYVVDKNDVVYTEYTSEISGRVGKVYKIPIPADMKTTNYNRTSP